MGAAGPLTAQGVTGAAVEGRALGVDGTPVEEATVLVANTSNGERWRTATNARGRYFIEYLSVGGPYRVEVRAIGYEPMQQDSIFLALGQRRTVDFGLTPTAVRLQEITVTSTGHPHFSTARTGPDLPLGFRLGLIYIGASGIPLTYVVEGDANADGFFQDFAANDAVYLPKNASDITLADPAEYTSLDSLIRDEPCLRAQRGALMKRNSCRDPWVHETQARLSKRFGLAGRRVLEVTADLFNVLNFVDGDWGLVRETLPHEGGHGVGLLRLVGYDDAKGRGVYELATVYRRQIDLQASRWRLQLGASLSF